MNKEHFISLCEGLHNSIIEKFEKKEKKDNGIDLNEIAIMCNVSEIIDSTHGTFQTDDERINNLFQEVFEAAASIKRNSDFVSHNISLMKKTTDENKLDEITTTYLVSRKMLLNAYKNALLATEKVMNLGRKK